MSVGGCCREEASNDLAGGGVRSGVDREPFSRGSRHSKVISNWYLSPNLAGLLRTSTPRSVTTDILAGWVVM